MKLKRIFVFINFILISILVASCSNNNSLTTSNCELQMVDFDGNVESHNFEYSDSYFLEEPFNSNLVKASFATSYCTVNINSDEKDNNIKKMMNEMGYGNIYTVPYFYEETDIDNIGISFASKNIKIKDKKYTVIAVIIRGNEYGFEWVSNFVIGKNGDHKGFKNSSIKLIEELNKYALSIKAKDTILWLSGYSRAGAVAAMSVAYIDNYINYQKTNKWLTNEYKIDKLNFNIEYDDIYCYTFESPSGATIENQKALKDVTNNIYNIISASDIVPMVLPTEFGFTKYGITKSYELTDDLASKLNELYKDGYKPQVDEYVFTMKKLSTDDKLAITTEAFTLYLHKLDSKITTRDYYLGIVDYLIEIFQNRYNYSEIVDPLLEEAFGYIKKMNKEQRKDFVDKLLEALKNANITTFLVSSKLQNLLKGVFEQFNIELSDSFYKSINDMSRILVKMISKEITADSNGYMGKRVAILYANFDDIVVNHFPQFIYQFISLI